MQSTALGIRLILFFFNDTATTEIYTLSLHDALPICRFLRLIATFVDNNKFCTLNLFSFCKGQCAQTFVKHQTQRSEEHTSELQSRQYLVCRLLLEKKRTAAPQWWAPRGRPQSGRRTL